MNMLGIALLALVLQVPPQQQTPGFIEGVVVKIGTGEPLRDASVALNRVTRDGAAIDPVGRAAAMKAAGGVFHRTATTDQNGRFVFADVLPGDYQMIATKSAYVPAEYGQRAVTGKGIEFHIAAGQKMAGVQLAMAPTGSIAGRIYDRDGEPLVKAQVQALRAVYKDGRRSMTIVQMAETDDRGEYRLFWLAPGRYYVSVKPDVFELPIGPMGFVPGGPKGAAVRITEPARFGNYEQAASAAVRTRRLRTGEVVEETSTPVFYPGTIDMLAAAPITVPAAATVGGVDISTGVGILPARHIRGQVMYADGRPVATASVMALPRDAGPVVSIPSASTNADGFFDIAGALPGRYFLVSTSRGSSAMVPVEVGERDVANIPLVLTSGFSISGRFIVEGRSRTGVELRPGSLRIAALTREHNLLGMPSGGPSFNPPAQPDGSFKVDGVSVGDFYVRIGGVPPDGYVKSIRMGNADVLNDGLHITGPPEGLLEVVVSANAGSVGGSVVNSRQETAANRTVVLIPDARLRHRTDLYKVAASDGSGRFRFQGIAPGDYKLFAWEDVETGAWHDPDFIRTHENSGKSIQVREGSDETLQLTVIQ